jgi:hypothetical protein
MKTRCAECGAVVRLRAGLRRRSRRKRRKGDTEREATTAPMPVPSPAPPPGPEPELPIIGVVELVPLVTALPPLPAAAAPAFRPPWRQPAVWAACVVALLLVVCVLIWCAR